MEHTPRSIPTPRNPADDEAVSRVPSPLVANCGCGPNCQCGCQGGGACQCGGACG